MMRSPFLVVVTVAGLSFGTPTATVAAFTPSHAPREVTSCPSNKIHESHGYNDFVSKHTSQSHTWSSSLSMADNSEDDRKIRLREEAESPFRKIRFFFYLNILGGALTSLFVSAARIAAALSGVNTDLMQESVVNAVVDIAGIAVTGFLFKQDVEAQESRVKRAAKGAELAKLMIRANKSLADDLEADSNKTFTTNLSSLRRGRGIDKRVVIAAAGPEKMAEILQETDRLKDSLSLNDLVVVPILYPSGDAPSLDDSAPIPDCVALPVGRGWDKLLLDEAEEAIKQGVNVASEGISIALKKNGRVGTRTKGVSLSNMVGDVEARSQMGLDVKNI